MIRQSRLIIDADTLIKDRKDKMDKVDKARSKFSTWGLLSLAILRLRVKLLGGVTVTYLDYSDRNRYGLPKVREKYFKNRTLAEQFIVEELKGEPFVDIHGATRFQFPVPSTDGGGYHYAVLNPAK